MPTEEVFVPIEICKSHFGLNSDLAGWHFDSWFKVSYQKDEEEEVLGHFIDEEVAKWVQSTKTGSRIKETIVLTQQGYRYGWVIEGNLTYMVYLTDIEVYKNRFKETILRKLTLIERQVLGL